MHSLSQIIICLLFSTSLFSQNPHGAAFKIDCRQCHTSEGWGIDAAFWKTASPDGPRFDHSKTNFELNGQHKKVDCRYCHESLIFSETSAACISCHTDVHQQTVGTDCMRCHDSNNWLIDDITELHQSNGFPLLGIHRQVDCRDCHFSESDLRFDRIGNQCVDCHLDKYKATTAPNHLAAGYSTDCFDCHDFTIQDWHWQAGAANHLFCPLTGGHLINDCVRCHAGGVFTNTPTDCYACHQSNYVATTSPNHPIAGFSTDCKICHTTEPGWDAGNFKQHDQAYFPIFNGRHENAWSQCSECHTTPNDYKAFSCIDCHEHKNAGSLANKHDNVGGYGFFSTACYSCHPKG